MTTQRLKRSEQSGGEHEVYETPSWCVRRLLEAVSLPAGRWLEPAAGSGAIIRAVNPVYLARRPPIISWTACDIRPETLEALTLLSPQAYTGDFLAEPTPERWTHDVAITNPPYSRTGEFIIAARAHAPVVAMLLPIQFYGSVGRGLLWHEHSPDAIWLLPDRPQFVGGRSSSLEYGWWIWGPLRSEGPRLRRLRTTPLAERRAG